MAERTRYDWEAIEKEWRANQLSNCEISRKYGAPESSIRYRAKKYNWSKLLGKKVREQVNEKLLREDLRGIPETDQEILEEAATRGASIVLLHRKDIANLRDIEAKLLSELENEPTKLYITQYQGEIISQEVGIAVTEKSTALNNLASVQQKRIQMERQAFNLNDGEDPDELKATTHITTKIIRPGDVDG